MERGPTPRVRGANQDRAPQFIADGTIPACRGSRCWTRSSVGPAKVHPPAAGSRPRRTRARRWSGRPSQQARRAPHAARGRARTVPPPLRHLTPARTEHPVPQPAPTRKLPREPRVLVRPRRRHDQPAPHPRGYFARQTDDRRSPHPLLGLGEHQIPQTRPARIELLPQPVHHLRTELLQITGRPLRRIDVITRDRRSRQ